MRLVLFALLLAGCHPTVTLQLTPLKAERLQWESDITKLVNDHDEALKVINVRLQDLQAQISDRKETQ